MSLSNSPRGQDLKGAGLFSNSRFAAQGSREKRGSLHFFLAAREGLVENCVLDWGGNEGSSEMVASEV